MHPRRILLALASAILVTLAGVPPALAQAPPVVTENTEAIAEFTYRSGGTAIPDGTCGSTCSDLWDVQRTLPPNANPAATEAVTTELVETGKQVKVLPPESLLARVSLGASAFLGGIWIGDLLNDKFLHIGGPAAPASPNYSSFALVWLTQGTYLNDLSYAPQDGFYLQGQPGNRFAFKRWTGPTQGSCSNLDPLPSDYLDLHVGQDACTIASGVYGWRQLHAYVYENGFTYPDPIEDYEGQPYQHRIGDWPNEPPTMAELEQRVQQAIDTAAFGLATDFYAHALAPEDYPDPRVTEEEQDHRCDVSGPAYENPDPDPTHSAYDEKIAAAFEVSVRPSGASGLPDPFLRYGETSWLGDYVDRWEGWGWRHIKAKHGWSEADEAATRQALVTPVTVLEQSATSMRYDGPQYQQNGVICERRVVVEFEAQTGDPAPKGIITSFARVVGAA